VPGELGRRAGAVKSEASRRYNTAKREVEGTIDDVRVRVDAGREAGKAAAKVAREELQRRLAEARESADDGATS
jgi:hypothetical protein